MVIQLKPYMGERVPAAIWAFLDKNNAAIIAERDAGNPPTIAALSELAGMILDYRKHWNTYNNTNNTNTKG